MVRHAPRAPRHPVDVHLGAGVRARRKARGLTQQDLAQALGLTDKQVAKYESGANRMNAVVLHDIALRLGCTVGDLYAGLAARAPRPASDDQPPAALAHEARLWGELRETFLDLPPHLRVPALGFLKSLASRKDGRA